MKVEPKLKSNLQDHLYLRILRFAYENDNFSEKEICKALPLTEDEFERFVRGTIAHHAPDDENDKKETAEQRWTMNHGAFINYLEYIELNEARKSSKRATIIAIFAILLSAISMFISIYFSKKQLETPTKIEKTQFELIENLKFDSSSIEKKMDHLINTQKKIIETHNIQSEKNISSKNQ